MTRGVPVQKLSKTFLINKLLDKLGKEGPMISLDEVFTFFHQFDKSIQGDGSKMKTKTRNDYFYQRSMCNRKGINFPCGGFVYMYL